MLDGGDVPTSSAREFISKLNLFRILLTMVVQYKKCMDSALNEAVASSASSSLKRHKRVIFANVPLHRYDRKEACT